MIADSTYSIEKSLRKSSVLNDLGTGFREIILYILSIHAHLFCSKTCAWVLTTMN